VQPEPLEPTEAQAQAVEAELEAQELRARREAWERRAALEQRAQRAALERRVGRVQLARLEVPDLLALLGLPVPQVRPDPPGLVVFRVQRGL